MAGRVPKSRKPAEQLRRRNRPEDWTVLPAAGCDLPAPKWPSSKASSEETALWLRLWALPVAAYWHATRVEPFVVARYVRLALSKPEHATVSKLESELALTPASLLRLRLLVEEAEPEEERRESVYAHLRAVDGHR